MTRSESLFLSSAEMDRRQRAAKELRAHYLRGLVREVRHKLSTQRRSVAVVEVSLALTLLMVGVFWAALIGWHDATEAGTDSGVNPEQITINAPRDLPSFNDRYRRHTGVLDTLDYP
jgi:hypothetical protein